MVSRAPSVIGVYRFPPGSRAAAWRAYTGDALGVVAEGSSKLILVFTQESNVPETICETKKNILFLIIMLF